MRGGKGRFNIQCVLTCLRFFAAPWSVVHQAPLSMEFSRQEYWRGLPFPFPEDLLNLRNEPTSLASPALAGEFFTTRATLERLQSNLNSWNQFNQCNRNIVLTHLERCLLTATSKFLTKLLRCLTTHLVGVFPANQVALTSHKTLNKEFQEQFLSRLIRSLGP